MSAAGTTVVRASDPATQTLIEAAVRGDLVSQPQGRGIAADAPREIEVVSKVPFPLLVFRSSTDGDLEPLAPLLRPYDSLWVFGADSGTVLTVTSAPTGGIVSVVRVRDGADRYVLTDLALAAPNGIGLPPEPRPPAVLVPGDSPRVVVGAGWRRDGAILVREQYWRRGSQSVTLMPGESRTSSVTQTSGVEQSSALEEAQSQTYGASASAGWGPVSIGISASLNLSTRTSQQVTVTSSESAFQQIHVENRGPDLVTYLSWELIDSVTALDPKTLAPTSTLTSVLTPPVVRGPYAVAPALEAGGAA